MYNKKLFCVFGIFLFFLLFYYLFLSAPVHFPTGNIVSITEGESLRSVSLELQQENVIRSRAAFETFVILYGGEKHMVSADYLLESKLPVFEIARRIVKGYRNLAPVKITVPEGFDNTDIAGVAAPALHLFNTVSFLTEAKQKQGYLFPDTYFFFTDSTETDVITSMRDNYEKKVTPLRSEISAAGKTEKQIIIMASIIEKESKGSIDRGVISGILWKRLSLGIPLQVDAAPETYKTKGLPLGPICNPGLPAIIAAIHPTNSPYLYYLHDKNGIVHYAQTFAQHLQNKVKYLK